MSHGLFTTYGVSWGRQHRRFVRMIRRMSPFFSSAEFRGVSLDLSAQRGVIDEQLSSPPSPIEVGARRTRRDLKVRRALSHEPGYRGRWRVINGT